MKSNLIYHICNEEDYKSQSESLYYSHESLIKEGFIHCSRLDQIKLVLNRYFKEVKGLYIITIDTDLLISQMIFEPSTNNELFPHIYGVINKSAIIAVESVVSYQLQI